ncbi:hypothetical protein EDB85DRAFT_2201964 [Lactarius pseudohatsudake]|nr:hypothetical protein EDB85DRAFT_2201964 [Lactarius pseudohatsudake]
MPMSDFEYLSSATVDQPAPTLSSTSPSSSSISPMFVPSATEDQSEPEFTPTLFASVPTLTSTPSHVHSATGYGTIFASTPPSSSPTSSPCLPAVTEEQPEPETESIPSITLASTFALTPPSSSTFLPSPTQSVIVDRPESEPASTSEFSKFGLSPRALQLPPDQTLAPLLSSSILSSLPPPEISTLDSTLAAPSPDQPSSLGPLSQLSRPCELVSSTPVSAADVVTLSHPELSLSSPGEPVPFLPASLEAPPIAPISPNSSLPQQPPRIKTFNSDSSLLEVTPLASSVPQQSQELLLAYEVSLIKPPALAPRPSASARFNFALSLITFAALVSTFFNVSAALLTHTRKFRGKQDIIRINTLKCSSRNNFAQQLRLGQYTPRAPRLVFDPGGVFKFKRSSSRLPSAHEDVRKRMPKTRNGFITHVAIPVPVPIDNLVFDPGGQSSSSTVQAFKFQDYLRHAKTFDSARRSHAAAAPRPTPTFPFPFQLSTISLLSTPEVCSLTGDGQDFDPPGGVRPAFGLSPKPHHFRISIASATRPLHSKDILAISYSSPLWLLSSKLFLHPLPTFTHARAFEHVQRSSPNFRPAVAKASSLMTWSAWIQVGTGTQGGGARGGQEGSNAMSITRVGAGGIANKSSRSMPIGGVAVALGAQGEASRRWRRGGVIDAVGVGREGVQGEGVRTLWRSQKSGVGCWEGRSENVWTETCICYRLSGIII